MTEDSPVRVERREGVALLYLNRPERLNAWNAALKAATPATLLELADDPSVRGVIITGAGRAFCAGADLKEPGTHSVSTPDEHLDQNRGSPIFDVLGHYPKPVIAAVNGYAIGVGCLMTVSCDFVIASERAVFALPQTSLGIIPAYGGTLRLARFVGRGNALNMALTGRHVGAEEALRMGLVTELVEHDELIPRAVETMQAITEMPPHAVRLTRESLRYGYEAGLPATEQSDLYRQMGLFQTEASADEHKGWRGRGGDRV